jgi:hypothetical protein
VRYWGELGEISEQLVTHPTIKPVVHQVQTTITIVKLEGHWQTVKLLAPEGFNACSFLAKLIVTECIDFYPMEKVS